MKELLQERLKNLKIAVEQKKAESQQANADMNVLIGHAQECSNIIALLVSKEKEDAAKSLECADSDHDHCKADEKCDAEHVHCETE